jgi:hypothetical protein
MRHTIESAAIAIRLAGQATRWSLQRRRATMAALFTHGATMPGMPALPQSLCSRAWPLLLAAAPIALSGIPAHAAAARTASVDMHCPPRLQVTQTPQPVSDAGWHVGGSEQSHPLVTVSFFAGPPEQKAQLVPTSESRKGRLATATWTLERREQAYWVACEYGGTSAIASRALPPEVSACTVEYDPAFSEPVVKRWRCR